MFKLSQNADYSRHTLWAGNVAFVSFFTNLVHESWVLPIKCMPRWKNFSRNALQNASKSMPSPLIFSSLNLISFNMSQYFRVCSMFSYWNVLVLNSFFHAFNYFILRCVPLCFCALYKKYSLHSIYNHSCQNHENLTVYSLTVLQVLKFGLHYQGNYPLLLHITLTFLGLYPCCSTTP